MPWASMGHADSNINGPKKDRWHHALSSLKGKIGRLFPPRLFLHPLRMIRIHKGEEIVGTDAMMGRKMIESEST